MPRACNVSRSINPFHSVRLNNAAVDSNLVKIGKGRRLIGVEGEGTRLRLIGATNLPTGVVVVRYKPNVVASALCMPTR